MIREPTMSDTTELSRRDPSAVTRTANEPSARRMTITPAVDIYEDSHGVTLWDKLDVRVHDGNLAIEAEAVVPTPANLRLQHAEVREPRFARTFTLSPDFDTAKIEANLKDSVLKLTIPRRDEARPRRIEVRTD
jgi:HSP20 family protein